MYSLNRAQIIGYLSENPEIRKTPNGQSVGDLRLITKYSFKDSEGNMQDGIAYHSVVVWRGLADVCGLYLKQGSQIYIAGRLNTDTWEGEDGQKKSKTKIIADEMIMLDSKNSALPENIPAESVINGALNKVEIIGNLTRDPELRTTPTGTAVTTIGVATNLVWKDKEGEEKQTTEFHNVVLWNNLASDAAKYLQKGKKIYASGRLQTRSWETPTGEKRYATEIIADRILLLGIPAPDTIMKQEKELTGVEKIGPASQGNITPDMIPEIKYGSNVKPEDLPF